MPRGKSVLDLTQRGFQLGIMSKQDGRHVVIVDPVETNLCVGLWGEICREEPVAVQPSGRHEDKDEESCIAKPEPLRLGFREHANHQVYTVYVVVINASHLLRPDRVGGQLLKGFDLGKVKQLSELVVPRHTEFSGTQYVGCCEVLEHNAWLLVTRSFIAGYRSLELLQSVRVVVQGESARVGDAERVEEIWHADLF